MQHDPFGNLVDWGEALDRFEELVDSGRLAECQPGLIRVLRFKGNWRLREEVLKHAGEIQTPTIALISEVLSILADDNVYYDARVMAGDALIDLLKNVHAEKTDEMVWGVKKVVEKLMQTIHPPFFDDALSRVHEKILAPYALEN
jgi:hypothetical protein